MAPRSRVICSMPRWAACKIVPPGVSYMPRDFMPTKRFSTRSSRPMPFCRPSSFSRASSRAGESAAPVLGDRNLVLLGELQQPGARGQIPFAPGRDHLHVGLERVIGELEAHLVVALAGRPMRDRVGADLLGDLDLLLG